MLSSTLLALAASFSSALAATQGFNYGATNSDGSNKFEAEFTAEFKAAQALSGAPGTFNSARLYTMIQGGSSTNEPIQAIPAAISTKTSLLLGLWASGGQGFFSAEITALKSAIDKWGTDFTDLVVGISVGSEDLYRDSEIGKKANAGIGVDASVITDYIGQLREAIKDTSLSGASIGHVDTWTAWVDGANVAVIDAVDWLGFDGYPYFQDTQSNAIGSGKELFDEAVGNTTQHAAGKPVWITETGWPVSGKVSGLAEANTENAKTYWNEVGCPLFGKTNTWWYTLIDATPDITDPSFGITRGDDYKPQFDLSCDAPASTSSKSSSASATKTGGSGGSGSGSSSTASSASSAATDVVSSGGGLSPSQATPVVSNGTGSGSATATGFSNSTATGQSTTALITATTVVSGGAGTTATGSSPSSSSSGPATVDTNAATALSGSFIGAMIALGAAVVAL